jgi:PST family polysaccharide transporter
MAIPFTGIIQSNRQVLKNMTWLGILQFANYLIPLLIIPYIVRVLGVDIFGKITYAQNIISYFTLIINFGFEYSATREIAVNKGNHKAITQIFWSVLKQKAALLLLSFVGLVVLYFVFSKVTGDITLYFFVFLMNVGIVIFPTWFFQGMEEMGKMAVFNVLIKGLGLILTVLFVKKASDYLIYPLLTSLAYICFGIGALVYVIKHFNIEYTKSDKATNLRLFHKSFPIFLNNLFVSGYTITNMTMLGFYVSDKEIGYYSGAFKIIMAILMVTSTPINMAIFPAISRKFAESKVIGLIYFKKTILHLAIISIFISVLTFIASPLLVKLLLGKEFESSINLLKLFSILPFLVILASLFTVQGLYGAGLQRYAPWIGAILGIFCISFNLFFIPVLGMYGAAWGWVISEFLEIILAGSFFYIGFYKKIKHIEL